PASWPPAPPGHRAAPRCSGPVPGAWPRRGRGAPRRRPDPRRGRGQGRGRSERSRHSGLPPRSAGSCLPPERNGRHRTVPWPGPHGCCGRPAPPPRHVQAVRRPRRDFPGSADRALGGTTRNCRPPDPAARYCRPPHPAARRPPAPTPHPAASPQPPNRPTGPLPRRQGPVNARLVPLEGPRCYVHPPTPCHPRPPHPGRRPVPGFAGRRWPGDFRRGGNRGRRTVLLTYVQILPSGAPHAAGLVLAPFRGLRYAQDRVSGLAEVTSPPYDVIAHDTEDHLLASDPHNIVRLILPRHDAHNPRALNGARAEPAYADAARLLRGWQDEGILVPDPVPALYVYEQTLAGGHVLQRGLIGALRLAPLGAGPVLPHEDVIPGPVAGRRQLMEATGANLEPIFLLYDGSGPGAVTAQLIDRAISREALVSIHTDDGIWHRLWAVTDPAEQAEIAADLGTHQA